MKIEAEIRLNEFENRVYISRSDMLMFRFYFCFTELPTEIQVDVKRNRIPFYSLQFRRTSDMDSEL